MSILALLLIAVATAAPTQNTLTGRVLDDHGAPLVGAVVKLHTAKPRSGLAVTCPSCYRDCAKSAKTDAEGQFSIGGLDPNLLFHVLVMAPERKAELTKWTDPAQTKLVVKLAPVSTDVPVDRMLTGRVVDEHGKPLAGAVVTPIGAKTNEKRWWGQLPGVDEAAVTDGEGRFVIVSQDSKLGLDARVSAPGYADYPGQLFDLDGSEHEIRMRRGASVSGRLLFESKPVQGRAVGIVQQDRSSEHFVGEVTLATDNEGAFLFANLQPNEPYVLYSVCDAAGDLPVFKTVQLTAPANGEIKQLGDLTCAPGLILAGRVELPAGSKMPAGAKVRVSRDPAWDWCEMALSNEGEFAIHNLPPEVYSVSVVAPGFQIDKSQMYHQLTSASTFGIRLRRVEDATKPITVPMMVK